EILYGARRSALEAEAEVLEAENDRELLERLDAAITEDQGMSPRHERSFRLQTLTDLLTKVQHPGSIRLLFRILDDAELSVSLRANRALREVGYRRYREFVREAEGWVDLGAGSGLVRLPALLTEVTTGSDPVPVALLVKLLNHGDADVVAEAACALAESDEPNVVDLLSVFRDDPRPMEDTDPQVQTLGDLIQQLIAAIELGSALSRRAPLGQA
ncbi:MAG: hypothetical protein KC416_14410, partial [Myxococcales bacterium]|nr:hypothetical protein [Myxococcales bacterium]